MIVFIDNIINGNIEQLLGSDLYAETISKIVVWWSVLPMVGILFSFGMVLVTLFKGRDK